MQSGAGRADRVKAAALPDMLMCSAAPLLSMPLLQAISASACWLSHLPARGDVLLLAANRLLWMFHGAADSLTASARHACPCAPSPAAYECPGAML